MGFGYYAIFGIFDIFPLFSIHWYNFTSDFPLTIFIKYHITTYDFKSAIRALNVVITGKETEGECVVCA